VEKVNQSFEIVLLRLAYTSAYTISKYNNLTHHCCPIRKVKCVKIQNERKWRKSLLSDYFVLNSLAIILQLVSCDLQRLTRNRLRNGLHSWLILIYEKVEKVM
jgi:hypothetical protein